MKSHFQWRWPLDVLHVSDLHFFGKPELDKDRDAAWKVLREDVARRTRKGQVYPHLIACTGDLVETPSRDGFRRGINALLELAADCAFLEEPAVWREGEARPPRAWWELLDRRIFLIPGNHDVFTSGLRILFFGKSSRQWAEITDPEAVVPAGRLEPTPAALAGPLALRMIDSNGSRAFWKTARGSVDRQMDLSWPPDLGVDDRHFRMALVHAHPMQVPFFVQGVFDDEASLMMDNAGFLLKNLADLGVRLILHGHRHYPCCYALSLQDSHDATRSIAIVGAGSATKAPARWKNVSYNWVRIYPDHRVEVRILRRDPQAPTFSGFGAPIAATLGDFSCQRLDRTVRVWNSFGDLEVTTRFTGLRAVSGRPPVRRIPFERRSEPSVELTAQVLRGSAGRRQISWDTAAGSLELDPPLDAAIGAVDLEVRYHLYGGAALTTWQAVQMYGAGDRETQRFSLDFDVRDVSFEVHLGNRFSPPDPGSCRARFLRPGLPAANRGAEWKRDQHVLSMTFENPKPPGVLELEWPLPEAHAPAVGPSSSNQWASVRFAIRSWQQSLLRSLEKRPRVLDALCREIAAQIGEEALREPDVALFLPVISDLEDGEPAAAGFPGCRLLRVGVYPPPEAEEEPWSVPFGQGVEGRSHRSGRFLFFHKMKADDSVRAYRAGDSQTPTNFHRDPPDRHYVGYACCPIFPLGMARLVQEESQESVEARRPECTMLVLAIGATRLEPFMSWDDRRLAEFFTEVLRELEIQLWVKINPGLSNGLTTPPPTSGSTEAPRGATDPEAEE